MTILYRMTNGVVKASNVKPQKVPALLAKGWMKENPVKPKAKPGRKPKAKTVEE